jgi:hypothetical protein
VQRSAPSPQEGGGWIPLAVGFAKSDAAPPENANDYPEAGMFGPLPARFLFARHVDNLAIEGLRLKTTAAASAAPLFWFDDIEAARFADIHVPDDATRPICNPSALCHPSVALSAN